MQYSFDEAKKLIRDYQLNQIEQTKQANTRRGITKKSLKDEQIALSRLLIAIMKRSATQEEIDELTTI